MGSLHRARHHSTGEIVAMKTVGHVLRSHLRGLRREIRALQTVDHPNVVRIVDSDINATPPWYAMELIDGMSLDRHWHVVPTERRWSTYLGAFADVCDGLAFVHGHGLIHRDLKPGNIVLRTSHHTVGEAVVVDFGLATVAAGGIGREQLYKRSEVVGTPQYMSPEQVRQEHLDPRADLYALGCMLFEALCGHPPFLSDVPFTGMLKHLNETPVIPAHVAKRAPERFSELVLALLEKDPANRPTYATDVREILSECGDVEPVDAAKPRPRTYLHRPRFVGRDAHVDAYQAAAERMAEDEGGVVVIRGPAGAGKSRLAIELMRRIQELHDDYIEVFVTSSARSETTAPLGSLRPAFEEIAEISAERGEQFAEEVLGAEGTLLARHLPVLGGVPGVARAASISGALVGPQDVEQVTLDAITAVLERMADKRPVVLALDDAQWADPLTRLWLQRVHEQRPWDRVPFLLLVIHRDDDDTDAFLGPVASADALVLEVGPLLPEHVGEMVASMSGVDDVPTEFLAAIEADARGLPSRVAQWLSAAVARDALVRDAGQWRFEGVPIEDADIRTTITGSVSFHDLLAQRLKTLDQAHRSLIEIAAVLGPTLRPDVLSHLSGAEHEALDDLVTDGILIEAGRDGVQFASPELFEVAMEPLRARPRSELHVRAAAMLDAIAAPSREVAHHLAQAGWRDEARTRLMAAGDSAFAGGDWAEAEHCYAAALELGLRNREQEVVAWARIAVLRWRHRDADAAQQALHRAQTTLIERQVGPRASAELARARGLLHRGSDPSAAADALNEARELFQFCDLWTDERDVWIELGNLHCRRHAFAEGREVFMAVHDRARELGDREGVAVALASVGTTWISSGKLEPAADFLERAVGMFRALDAGHRIADALYNLGVCRVDLGQLQAAIAAFDEVATLRTLSGDQRQAAIAQSALGHAKLMANDVPAARADLQSAVTGLRRFGATYERAVAHSYLGQAHAEDAELMVAMDHWVEALKILNAFHSSPLPAYIQLDMARIHRRCGYYHEALVHIERSREAAHGPDPYLDALREIENGLFQLATTGESTVDVEAVKSALERCGASEASVAHRLLRGFIASRHAPAEQRHHGELADRLPAAFRS